MTVRLLKIYFILLAGVFFAGCESYIKGSVSEGSQPSGSNSLKLTNFVIQNVKHDSFEMSYNFAGDANNNSDIKIYYCSIKEEPGCNPLNGSSSKLTPSGNKIAAKINLKSPHFTQGDILKYTIVSTDEDGYSGGGMEFGHIIIPFDGSPRLITQLGYVSRGSYKDASGNELVRAMATDSERNIYITGGTTGSLGEPNSEGDQDIFIIKADSTGKLDTKFGGGDGIVHLGIVTVGLAASGDDEGYAIKLDNDGNIYVAGLSNGSFGETGAGYDDIIVVKLDKIGRLDTSFGGGDGIVQLGNDSVGPAAASVEEVAALEIDANGNIYVAGNTKGSLGETNSGNNDAFVVKLTASGNLDTSFGGGDGISQLGSVTVGAPASGHEYVRDMKLDSNGKIVINGRTSGSLGETTGGSYDVFVARLNPDGDLDSTFNIDGIFQLGNVTANGDVSTSDDSFSIAIDANNNVFIGGNTSGSLGEAGAGSNDIFVLKLDASGIIDTSFGGGDGVVRLGNVTIGAAAASNDIVSSISLDSNGNIFIAGNTTSSLGDTNVSPGLDDVFVVKLDSAGNLDTSFGHGDGIIQLGSTTIGSASSEDETVSALILDSNGNILVAGFTKGSMGETFAGSNDAFVVKLGSAGDLDTNFGGSDGILQIGSLTVGSGASATERVNSIAVDNSGNIFVAGQTNGSLGEANAGGYDAFVFKLNSSGNLDKTFGDGDGIVQLGQITIGNMASKDEEINAMEFDGSGNIFVAGTTYGDLGESNAGSKDVYVVKLNSLGSLDTSFGGGDGIVHLGNDTLGSKAMSSEEITSMKLDSSGNIFIGGSVDFSYGETVGAGLYYDAFVIKLDPSGNLDTSYGGGDGISQLGFDTMGAAAAGHEFLYDLVLDASGQVIFTGQSSGSLGEANAGSYDAIVVKLDTSGSPDTSFGGGDGIVQLGNVTIGAAASGNDRLTALALDGGGNIIIAGYTAGSIGEANVGGNDIFVVKIDSSGNLDNTFGGGDGIIQLGNVTAPSISFYTQYVRDMKLDSSGNVFITGNTNGSFGETAGGSYDVYVVKLDSSGSLDISFGGGDGIVQAGSISTGDGAQKYEGAEAMALDSSGNIFVAGQTAGSLGEINAGGSDAYVYRLDSSGEAP